MITLSYQERRRLEQLPRGELKTYQLERFSSLLQQILPHNRFYARKLDSRGPSSLDEMESLPFTYKDELLAGHQGLAANLTWPVEKYVRFHQTSGTRGRPLPVLDTADDWQWWINCWQYVLDAGDVQPGERLLLAFSFGPFIGFWSAFDAGVARGCMAIPGGGMTSLARLELLRSMNVSVLLCTPSYALHLAEVAAEHQIQPQHLAVRLLILAGEPGGSVPATRQRIETAWNARVLDHCGASEIGPWGYGDSSGRGLYVNEAEFLPEFRSLEHGGPAAEGELSELVLTNLGRAGSPIIRYRTGDLVRPVWQHGGDRRFVYLDGGVLGRTDDMLIVRGVNVFPSAIEQILRSFPEIAEFRMTVTREKQMDQLAIEVEDRLNQPARVAEEVRLRLGLRVTVSCVPLGTLPRFEGKGRRLVDQR
jgi:phenylacetate-CoA ligase